MTIVDTADKVEIWLPEQRVTRLLNTNDARYHNYHARHAGQVFWESMIRGQLDTTFLIERAYVEVRFYKPGLHQADVGNYFPTAKAIVDGLVRKADKHGQMQDGFFADDNDKRIVGPDLRRGLDPALRRGREQWCRIRVTVVPIGPLVERWWEPDMTLPLDLGLM